MKSLSAEHRGVPGEMRNDMATKKNNSTTKASSIKARKPTKKATVKSKVCVYCETRKKAADFSKYSRNADGLADYCRPCRKEIRECRAEGIAW